MAKKLGITLAEYDFPTWPDDVLHAPPDYWLRLLGDQATVQSFFGTPLHTYGIKGFARGFNGDRSQGVQWQGVGTPLRPNPASAGPYF